MSAAQTSGTQAAGSTPPDARQGRRQQKIGRVMSDKMQKTIVVAVESIKRHRIYKRTYKQTKRYKVHDEQNSARMGDIVRIEETRPLSKEKRWRLVEILQRAAQTMPVGEVEAALAPEAAEEAAEEEEEE